MTSIFVLMFLFVKFQSSAFLFNVHVPFVAHGVLVSLCTINSYLCFTFRDNQLKMKRLMNLLRIAVTGVAL